MTALQWALLLLGVGVAAILVISSRREKRSQEPGDRPSSRMRVGTDWNPEPIVSGGETGKPRGFDEFGVGRPRRRTEPEADAGSVQPSLPGTENGGKAPPRVSGNRATKLVGLYIAEHERTDILGPRIHAALKEQRLEFGARRIYHRIRGDQTLFSVASLVKPGSLDPQESDGFSTPGLSVFMVLPGPSSPVAAFQDMLETARRLATSLNAELFDSEKREPLTPEREKELHAMVEDWERRHATGK